MPENTAGMVFYIEKEPEEELSQEEVPFEKVSLWVVDTDFIRPSTQLSLINKLPSGIYKVGESREFGSYCKKINIATDELFIFSNSVIPLIIEEINQFLDKEHKYKEEKLVHKRGILLYGYPGSGKTSLISLLSNEFCKKGGIAFMVSSGAELSNYIFFIKNYFRKIQPDTPIMTIIEDIDRYDEVGLLSDFLDGRHQIEHHVVISTSNNTNNIPDILLRPSRIDLHIEVPIPDSNVKREYLSHKSIKDTELIEKIVNNTPDFSLADLKELYIAIAVLGYSFDHAFEKVNAKYVKKNFGQRKNSANKMGIG